MRHIFQLPTEYATVLDVDKLRSFSRFSPLGAAQGGVHFFRPCAAVRLCSPFLSIMAGQEQGQRQHRWGNGGYLALPSALTACLPLVERICPGH